MELKILIVIVISVLLAYIVYLHFQLSARNIFIQSSIRRLSGIEHCHSIDEMIAFLQKVQKGGRNYSGNKEKFPDDNTLKFILEDNQNLKIFVHYTKEESVAMNILQDGFKFASSFYKTALPVSIDKLDMTIKHNSRKLFGDYIIIICISSDIASFYTKELMKANIRNHSFENILTEKPPLPNDNSDLIYQLAPQYIKGFINSVSGEIIKNPAFDPYYNSPNFVKNIELLKAAF
jgi:hypothetical protein